MRRLLPQVARCRWLRQVAVAAGGIGIRAPALFFSLRGVSGGELEETLRGADAGLLVLALVIFAASLPTRAWRWHFLLADRRQLRWRKVLEATIVGFAWELPAPGTPRRAFPGRLSRAAHRLSEADLDRHRRGRAHIRRADGACAHRDRNPWCKALSGSPARARAPSCCLSCSLADPCLAGLWHSSPPVASRSPHQARQGLHAAHSAGG